MASPVARIAALVTPGMGHLIPMAEFAKRLLHHHHIATTFIIPTDGPLSAQKTAVLSPLPPPIHSIFLPDVNLDDLPDGVKIETRISITISRALPSIRDAVKSLHERHRLSAFVSDLFGTDGFEVAMEFKIPSYIFFPSTAMVLVLLFRLPELDETVSCEYRELPEKIRLPGCVPFHGRDLIHPLQERTDDAYKWFLHHAKKYKLAEGIIINSCKAIEPGAVEALQKGEVGNPTIYPIGPLIQIGRKLESNYCTDWLDHQPSGSVLYVSFGSGGTLSHEQMVELALGLELSEQKFLWVIRCPNNKFSNAFFFNIRNSDDPLAYLPEGFVERTSRRGLVVPGWAPQPDILAHSSTGGFLTHCGWNSTLEGIVNGVAMIAWPLFAEQRMNAAMLNEDMRVAMRVEFGGNGVAGRVEIARVVKELMEGEEGKRMRDRIMVLQKAAAEATGENGASVKTREELAAKWKG